MNESDSGYKLETISPSRRRLAVEIPVEKVDEEYERILKNYMSGAKIPGFRKGRAPREMVVRAFNDDIRKDLYDELIPRALSAGLQSLNLKPVNTPKISDVKHDKDMPLNFKAEFEVVPNFDLPALEDFKGKSKPVELSDDEVGAALENIRARTAQYLPVSGRGVTAGDYVLIESQGRDLETGRLLPVEKSVVLAGHKENEAGLNDALDGLNVGESRSFRTSYANDHANKRLAGKEIEYRLTVKEIKVKKLAEIDDEFARGLGEYSGLAQLKDKIRDDLLQAKKREARDSLTKDILTAMAAKMKLEVPESLVEAESLVIIERALKAIQGRSISREAVQKLQAEARNQALERVTHHLIIDKLADKEGINASEEEIKEEVRRLAHENNVTPAAIEDYLRRQGTQDDLAESIIFRKSIDFLVKKAIID